VSVETWTARISTRDSDCFDITRKSGGPDGEAFAPSWAILRPALDARREGDRLRKALDVSGSTFIERQAWDRYVPAYTAEMRASYRDNRAAWDALLARSRVVLVCYCTDAARCHRTLLAGILGKLGAHVRGELPS
jgi:hypothetical protein